MRRLFAHGLSVSEGVYTTYRRERHFLVAHAAAHRVRFEAKGCLAKRATEGRGPLAKLRRNERHGRGAWAGWVGGISIEGSDEW